MPEQRDQYIENLRTKLDAWKIKIDQLQEKADQAEGGMKTNYQNQIKELNTKYSFTKEKLEHLVNSSENDWERIKAAADKAYEAMAEAVERLFPD